MKNRTYFLTLLLICLQFAGCSFLKPPAEGDKYFILEKFACEKPVDTAAKQKVMLVEETQSKSNIENRRIVFARSNMERGFYQYAFWMYPLTTMVNDSLQSYLKCESGFKIISDPSDAPKLDFQLRTEITNFTHDISSNPGSANVEIRARLISPKTGKLIEEKTFAETARVATYNSEGAVKAFKEAEATVEKKINDWLNLRH